MWVKHPCSTSCSRHFVMRNITLPLSIFHTVDIWIQITLVFTPGFKGLSLSPTGTGQMCSFEFLLDIQNWHNESCRLWDWKYEVLIWCVDVQCIVSIIAVLLHCKLKHKFLFFSCQVCSEVVTRNHMHSLETGTSSVNSNLIIIGYWEDMKVPSDTSTKFIQL